MFNNSMLIYFTILILVNILLVKISLPLKKDERGKFILYKSSFYLSQIFQFCIYVFWIFILFIGTLTNMEIFWITALAVLIINIINLLLLLLININN